MEKNYIGSLVRLQTPETEEIEAYDIHHYRNHLNTLRGPK